MDSRQSADDNLSSVAAGQALRSSLLFIVSAASAVVVAILLNVLNNTFATTKRTSSFSDVLGSGKFFDEIAPSYDKLNRVISFGLDQSWRRYAAAAVRPPSLESSYSSRNARALDVATGTGDLAQILVEDGSYSEVVAIDPSREMLNVMRRKLGSRVRIVEGEAESLPFESESFDAITVAFGVRNFADRERGLREIARVLRPSGRMVILEASEPAGHGAFDMVVRVFIRKIMPTLAALLSGRKESYIYLSESMRRFPKPDKFKQLLRDVGLDVKSHERLWPFATGPDMYVVGKMTERKA